MHKTGVTLVNLGAQRSRFRLKNRVNVGRGWALVLQLIFPSIRLDQLEKPVGVVPPNCLSIEAAPVGKKKDLVIYASTEPVDPPHFKRQEYIGPFRKRDSGSYWIYSSESPLLPYEERILEQLRADFVLSTDEVKMPRIDMGMLWFPQAQQAQNPLVIYVPLDRRNIRLSSSHEV